MNTSTAALKIDLDNYIYYYVRYMIHEYKQTLEV